MSCAANTLEQKQKSKVFTGKARKTANGPAIGKIRDWKLPETEN